MTWLGEKQVTPIPGVGTIECWVPVHIGWFAITLQRLTTATTEALSLTVQVVRERPIATVAAK